MSKRTSGGVTNRRLNTLNRLQQQLKDGVKTTLNGKIPELLKITGFRHDKLTEKDIERIKKEIVILKSRI